jgi:hypothetical protein
MATFDEQDGGAPRPSLLNECKIKLTDLPGGTQPGDEVTLTVDRIDNASGCAYLKSANEGSDVGDTASKEGTDQDENGTGDTSTSGSGVGQDITMGPMDKFKTYLTKKTVENQSKTNGI